MNYFVSYESLSEEDPPVMITQSEFMRRMKDMQEMSGQASMYGNFPDSYNLVVNANHPLVSKIVEQTEKKLGKKLEELRTEKEGTIRGAAAAGEGQRGQEGGRDSPEREGPDGRCQQEAG